MEFDKTLTSGSTKLLLMKLLEQQDMYGYQMIEELRRRSDHTFDLKSGTLYPLLHSLEQASSRRRAAILPPDRLRPGAARQEGGGMAQLRRRRDEGAGGRCLLCRSCLTAILPRWMNRSAGRGCVPPCGVS